MAGHGEETPPGGGRGGLGRKRLWQAVTEQLLLLLLEGGGGVGNTLTALAGAPGLRGGQYGGCGAGRSYIRTQRILVYSMHTTP